MSADLEGVKPWEDLGAIQTEAMLKIARAIRASDEATGMVLVPREATTEMRIAGWREFMCIPAQKDRMSLAYTAMIAAGGDDADV
jgi:predicted glycosyltransferase